MFDDGFGEYMDIYSCRDSIRRVGIWIWISDVLMSCLLKHLIVEFWFVDVDFDDVFHRGFYGWRFHM